ncbi:hypothetical protein J6590_105874, partial [Homalodisca vitripennis]
ETYCHLQPNVLQRSKIFIELQFSSVLGMTLNCPPLPKHFHNSFPIPLQGLISNRSTVLVHGSLGVLKPALDVLSGVGES